MKRRFFQFCRWIRDTLDGLCDRPDHLQRLSVIGAGFKSGSLVLLLIAILTWFGTTNGALALLVVPILGNALYIAFAAFIICIIVLIGLVKGINTLKAILPSGASVELETTTSTSQES